jgi:hypothetical protein
MTRLTDSSIACVASGFSRVAIACVASGFSRKFKSASRALFRLKAEVTRAEGGSHTLFRLKAEATRAEGGSHAILQRAFV